MSTTRMVVLGALLFGCTFCIVYSITLSRYNSADVDNDSVAKQPAHPHVLNFAMKMRTKATTTLVPTTTTYPNGDAHVTEPRTPSKFHLAQFGNPGGLNMQVSPAVVGKATCVYIPPTFTVTNWKRICGACPVQHARTHKLCPCSCSRVPVHPDRGSHHFCRTLHRYTQRCHVPCVLQYVHTHEYNYHQVLTKRYNSKKKYVQPGSRFWPYCAPMLGWVAAYLACTAHALPFVHRVETPHTRL